MGEFFQEIFASISHNKLRVALTGFSIGWGIFLLIVLLGAGNGVLRGIVNAWVSEDDNIVIVEPSTTQLSWEGLSTNRKIEINSADLEYICNKFNSNIRMAVPQLDTVVIASSGIHHSTTVISGYYPGYDKIKNNTLIAGRDINDLDIEDHRKVCVISTYMCDRLFPDANSYEENVGKQIMVYESPFKVVGIYQPVKSYDVNRTIFAPLSTINDLYFREDRFSKVSLVVDGLSTIDANNRFVREVRRELAQLKNFNPADKKAVAISNSYELYLQIHGIYSAVQYFLWIVGLSTLIAGIVGVSNIMIISVKERTREIGVRCAMGATPRQVTMMVMIESVIITLIFGYIGMMLGLGLTQLLDFIIDNTLGENNTVFVNPTVSLGVVMAANGVMLVAGFLAGYFPARRAANIKLVDALNDVG